MVPWSENRIKWYDRAVKYCGYDDALIEAVGGYLPKDETVCDLGCGTGYLARRLAELGYRVTAFDKSGITRENLRRIKEEQGLRSLTVTEGSWYDLPQKPLWDNVIMVMAGMLDVDLELFLTLAAKRLIIITKDDDRSHVQANGVSVMKHPEFELMKKQLQGCDYDTFTMTLQFGQPFLSKEEAQEYFRVFEADTESADSKLNLLEQRDGEYPWYLPNEKNMRVFAVRKKS